VLYVFGSIIAMLSYANGTMSPTRGPKGVGFFEGYTWLAVWLVIWQASSAPTTSPQSPAATPRTGPAAPCTRPAPPRVHACNLGYPACSPMYPTRTPTHLRPRRRAPQAFHGLAVTLVYKYADAIVKNFANSSVMAILVVVSVYFFNLSSNLNSWLGVLSVLVTTWVYMNIAIKMPKEVAPSEEKSGLLK